MMRRFSSFFGAFASFVVAVSAGASGVFVSLGFPAAVETSTGLLASEVVVSLDFEFLVLLVGVGFMRY